MTTGIRILIAAVVVAAAAGVFYFKETTQNSDFETVPIASLGESGDALPAETAQATASGAIDGDKAKIMCFGAERCVPCRMMVPVREALAETYPDTLAIEFVDVWQDRTVGSRYGIRVIPTTIFFDADGEEVYRQEGFMDKETIISRFSEHGVSLEETATSQADV